MARKRNTNCLVGMKCPLCGSLGPYLITVTCGVLMRDSGTDEGHGHEWDRSSACGCDECGFTATVRAFTIGDADYKEMRKLCRRPPDGRYICGDCAKTRGARWPRGHVATFHQGRCGQCLQWRGLCAVDDYNWPKGSKRPPGPGGGRD